MIYSLRPRGTGSEAKNFGGWESLGLAVEHPLPPSSVSHFVVARVHPPSTSLFSSPSRYAAMRGATTRAMCANSNYIEGLILDVTCPHLVSGGRSTLFTDPHSGMGPSGICVYLLSKNTGPSFSGWKVWARQQQQTMAGVPRGAGCPQ